MDERTRAIWDAGVRNAKAYLASGIIIPEGATPFADIWAATMRLLYEHHGASTEVLAAWDRMDLAQRDRMYDATPMSLRRFEECVCDGTFRDAVDALRRLRQ